MKYGFLALFALACIPSCRCTKDTPKKMKNPKIQVPRRVAVEEMPSMPVNEMAMQPEMEEVAVMPDQMGEEMDMESLEMPMMQEDMEEPINIEEIEAALQESLTPEAMEVDLEMEDTES